MSSVRMASLKPPCSSPNCACAGIWHWSNCSVASGCGAITAMCSEASSPGVSASTIKAVMPRVPACGSVLANTQ